MAIALVAHTFANNGTTPVTTPAINTTGANLIVIGVAWENTTPAISDNQSNTYTLVASQNSGTGLGACSLYYCSSPITSASHTFTSTNGTDPTIFVQAFSGAATSSPLDRHNSANTSGSTIQPGSVTPSVANELLVAVAQASSGGGQTLNSVSGGFTITDSGSGGPSSFASGLAYLIQTSAGTANPTFTFSAANTWLSAVIATFKPPSTRVYGFNQPFPA